MKFDVLHNFISPVTGRVLCDYNYVLLGNRQGIALPSPILIDIRLDLNRVKKQINDFINNPLPSLQYTYIWIGNQSNVPIAEPYIQLGNLPPFISPLLFDPLSLPVPGAPVNFGYNNIYTGGISLDVSSPITPSITLRVDPSNLPNLSKGKMWLGTVNAVPPVITIDAIPPFVHVVGSVNWDLRGALLDSYAVPQETGLDPGWIFIGDPDNPGQIIAAKQIFVSTLPPLEYQNIWIGNEDNVATPMIQIYQINLPELTTNNTWIGDVDNVAQQVLFEITAGTGLTTLTDEPIVGNGTILIADTTVVAGSYTSATITVNAQGQLTFAESTEPGDGTVTEVDTGTGLTGGPITTTGTISIADTGVVPGTYEYATITVNAQGQLLDAIDNITTIDDMMDDIAANADAIAAADAAIGILNVVLGIVGSDSTVIDNINDEITTINDNITTIESDIAGIIDGSVPISTVFTAIGDVSGTGPLSSDITLTLNTTLNNVPLATGDVDFNNYAITDLETLSFSSWNDMENKAQNGINFLFLWQFFGGGVS
jgi:hypothetical protein